MSMWSRFVIRLVGPASENALVECWIKLYILDKRIKFIVLRSDSAECQSWNAWNPTVLLVELDCSSEIIFLRVVLAHKGRVRVNVEWSAAGASSGAAAAAGAATPSATFQIPPALTMP